MEPINEKEKTLLTALNDNICFNKKEELIKKLSEHDENNTWSAGKACATCPPPEAREDFVKHVLNQISYVNDDGYFKNTDIVQDEVNALEHGEMSTVNAIVLHRTGGSSMSTAISSFKSTGVGTHFIIDKDGTIKQTASLKQYTYHIGKIRSKCIAENNCNSDEAKKIKGWGWNPKKIHDHEKLKAYPDRYPMNDDSVGIEVVAGYNTSSKSWEQATAQQSESIKKLVSLLKCNYNLDNGDIYEHDKISYKTEGEGANLYSNDI
ncbi:peptidoglycan recognition protein family protein [Xenorhabdus lircayensis]|uniref:N-acetylmuramoyl-L-alanine amidase n=1 Tax=Xenorhabdus lircayensis TaxID=2763499 RepID=A0ABS0UA56_9GAMM|nr:N-acetylmuramoyl-L-alanine amidase [Xenorhabdus lircayensis]MBI6550765.1 N-acetylmuramoyl-L-alanine amidase [Xenorhabdus lircayensis]